MTSRLDLLSACYREGGGEVTEMIELFENEIERFQAIVNRLPKTADGVPVIPKIDGAYHPEEWSEGAVVDDEDVEFEQRRGRYQCHQIDECYSTKAAAEAAK